MEFDITHLDKNLLIKTLFAHSAPLNLGAAEYIARKNYGDNVDGLTDEECEFMLRDYYKLSSGHIRILDYHKGKPMKVDFNKKGNGRVIIDSDAYDERNGKYRFFEALLNIFSIDEIFITKKGFRRYSFSKIPEHLIRTKEQEKVFKDLLKNTIEKESNLGKYWIIDESKSSYKNPLLQSIL
ncbi:MAG: hypothetical protein R2771_00030 [Saprospiraceae bacterium]